MSATEKISAYLCHVVGESPQRAKTFHASTIRRTNPFAIAIYTPCCCGQSLDF